MKLIYIGNKNAVIEYMKVYLIVPKKHIDDIDYISYLWANGGIRLNLDSVVKHYCMQCLDIDNV